jgi:hypothetical protein
MVGSGVVEMVEVEEGEGEELTRWDSKQGSRALPLAFTAADDGERYTHISFTTPLNASKP